MGKKIQWLHGRAQLADCLQDMAEQVRKGGFPFGPQSIKVPEDLEARLSLKVKKHGATCKLEWRLPAPEGREPAVDPRQEGLLPSSFKQVKKELARTFRALKQAVNEDAMPDSPLLDEFERLSRAFTAHAEPEWDRAAREYLGHMENLIRSARDGHREAVIHEIQDLQTRMVNCHRDYK
ncbi:MAG: GAK system XXXCH domain-containing protein [Syntrophobacteraceae bacterium]|jgi:XXXCH domain-containing protein|nr:GAK system XXXCH domain-containing protein [Syntrophobacteraceae bacterium]